MDAAGVRLAVTLPIGIPLSRPLKGRIDMRNHRKIVVIDNRITYCGSHNCADAAFAIKPKFAPWVDAMMRFEGPIVRQNQHVFAADWMAHVNEDLSGLLREPLGEIKDGFPAQVIATGATVRYSAMPEMFEIADVRGAARTGDHHALLRPGRADPGGALRQRPARRADDGGLPGAERQLDRRGGQPQLLFPAARRRRDDPRIRRRPAAHQVADARRRGHADRLGQHRPPQLRAELREQHPAGRRRADRGDARTPGELHRRVGARQKADVAAWSRRRVTWNNAVAMLGPVL